MLDKIWLRILIFAAEKIFEWVDVIHYNDGRLVGVVFSHYESFINQVMELEPETRPQPTPIPPDDYEYAS